MWEGWCENIVIHVVEKTYSNLHCEGLTDARETDKRTTSVCGPGTQEAEVG